MVQLWYKNFYFSSFGQSLFHTLSYLRSLARYFPSTFHRRRYFTCPRKCHDCENRGRNLQKFITPYSFVTLGYPTGDPCVHECPHATSRNTRIHVTLRIHSHCIVLFRVIYKILPSIRHSLKFLCPEDEARATCTYSLGIYLHTC